MADDSIFEQLDPETAALLNVARATSPVEPHAGLFAAMTAAAVAGPLPVPSTPRRKVMLGKLITAKALGIVGVLALTGGVAAATGSLPDPVQSPVSGAVEHVGVHIPDGNHGADVSGVARDTSGDGEDNHGATVSDTARDNHGHNKDDATTTTTVAGDDNSGPGNNGRGNANGHSKDHSNNGADDAAGHDANDDHGNDEVTTTTVAGSTTPTTADDHGGNSGRNGGESEAGHGGHGADD